MKEHTIKTVESGSIAEELELEPGDILLSINNEEIEDIFDYRFIIKDEYLEVVIRKKNEEEWILEIHFVHASDEWYINAEREFPGEDRYDGYVQLENGVGMMRIFVDEFEYALEQLTNSKEYPKLREKLQRVVTIAVGKLSYPTMKKFTEQLEILFPGLTINIFYIRNDFFGETITVSGLITGQDLVKQIKERQNNGEELGGILNIPSNMLRIGEQVFLDDMTVTEVEEKLGMKLVPVESGGKARVKFL